MKAITETMNTAIVAQGGIDTFDSVVTVALWAMAIIVSIGIPIAIARWIFRVNDQVDLLTDIRDELRHHNSVDTATQNKQQG